MIRYSSALPPPVARSIVPRHSEQRQAAAVAAAAHGDAGPLGVELGRISLGGVTPFERHRLLLPIRLWLQRSPLPASLVLAYSREVAPVATARYETLLALGNVDPAPSGAAVATGSATDGAVPGTAPSADPCVDYTQFEDAMRIHFYLVKRHSAPTVLGAAERRVHVYGNTVPPAAAQPLQRGLSMATLGNGGAASDPAVTDGGGSDHNASVVAPAQSGALPLSVSGASHSRRGTVAIGQLGASVSAQYSCADSVVSDDESGAASAELLLRVKAVQRQPPAPPTAASLGAATGGTKEYDLSVKRRPTPYTQLRRYFGEVAARVDAGASAATDTAAGDDVATADRVSAPGESVASAGRATEEEGHVPSLERIMAQVPPTALARDTARRRRALSEASSGVVRYRPQPPPGVEPFRVCGVQTHVATQEPVYDACVLPMAIPVPPESLPSPPKAHHRHLEPRVPATPRVSAVAPIASSSRRSTPIDGNKPSSTPATPDTRLRPPTHSLAEYLSQLHASPRQRAQQETPQRRRDDKKAAAPLHAVATKAKRRASRQHGPRKPVPPALATAKRPTRVPRTEAMPEPVSVADGPYPSAVPPLSVEGEREIVEWMQAAMAFDSEAAAHGADGDFHTECLGLCKDEFRVR